MPKRIKYTYCGPLMLIVAAGIAGVLFETEILSGAKLHALCTSFQSRAHNNRYTPKKIHIHSDEPAHSFTLLKQKMLYGKKHAHRTFTIHVLTDRLFSPDAVDLSPANGSIYFSQEEKGTIGTLDASNNVEIIIDKNTPIRGYTNTLLTSPMGIALDRNDQLYAVENCPSGRVVCFDLSLPGCVEGRTVDIPVCMRSFLWHDVALHSNGTIALVGSKPINIEGVSGDLSLAALLVYKPGNATWHLYRETAEQFSSVSFSESGETIVVSGLKKSRLAWFRSNFEQLMYGYSPSFDSPPAACAVMPDGTLLISQKSGTLLSFNPYRNTHREMLNAMPAPRFLKWDANKKRLLLAAESSGEILSLKPSTAYDKKYHALSFAAYATPYKPGLVSNDDGSSMQNTAEPHIGTPPFFTTAANRPFLTADFQIRLCGQSQSAYKDLPEYLYIHLYSPGTAPHFMTDSNQAPLLASTFKMRSGTIIQDTCTMPRCTLYNLLDNSRKEFSLPDISGQLNEVTASPWNILHLTFNNKELHAHIHLLWDPVNPRNSCVYIIPVNGNPIWGCLDIPETDIPPTHWSHAFTSSSAGQWICIPSD